MSYINLPFIMDFLLFIFMVKKIVDSNLTLRIHNDFLANNCRLILLRAVQKPDPKTSVRMPLFRLLLFPLTIQVDFQSINIFWMIISYA